MKKKKIKVIYTQTWVDGYTGVLKYRSIHLCTLYNAPIDIYIVLHEHYNQIYAQNYNINVYNSVLVNFINQI